MKVTQTAMAATRTSSSIAVPFDEPEIVQRRLGTVRFAVCAATTQDLPDGSRRIDASLIVDASTKTDPDIGSLRRRLPDATLALASNSRTVQALMCVSGVGVAVLPLVVGDRLPGLARLSLGEDPPGRDVWIGYHRDLWRVRAFVDFADSLITK